MRILLVEDEALLADAAAEVLRDEAYAVDCARDGATASLLMHVNDYDLAILDWTIPPPTGIELLREWRAAGKSVPVLMLTARGGIDDRVDGLDGGADDYLTKPFAFDELLARVRSLLRRRAQPLQMKLASGDLEMDRAQHAVTVGGEAVELSPKEFAVLEYFLRRRDEVVTRTELAEHVWDDHFDAVSNVIDVTVHRLRRKIDGDRTERLLHTIKGVGYMLKSRRE
jgi:DNA-binding response OmpR family regulator